MSSRVFTLFSAVLTSVLLAGSCNLALGQEADSLFELAETHSPPGARQNFYAAVMGEVERPGTYLLDQTSLTLHNLVRCAQGFRDNASMAIRVIRRGRFSQIEIFSDKSDTRLWPGDLLIVESKQSPSSAHKVAGFDGPTSDVTRADYYASDRSAVTQIGLVNLLDYPVVLKLRPEQANAGGLLKSLGQPLTLLSETHIITPDVPYRQSSDAAKKADRMQNCSVMVFEPDDSRQEQLAAKLPLPINTIQSDSPDEAIPPFQPANRRTHRQTVQSSSDDHFNTISGDRTNESNVILIPCDQFSPDYRFSQEPENGIFGQFKPAFAAKLVDSSTHDATPLVPALEDLSSEASDSSLPEAEGLVQGEEPEEMPIPQRSFLHLLVIVLAVGTLVCAALALRYHLEKQAVTAHRLPDLSDVFPMRTSVHQKYDAPVSDPTIPPRLRSDQLKSRFDAQEGWTELNHEPEVGSTSGPVPDILQMPQNSPSVASVASPLPAKAASQSLSPDLAVEPSTIAFPAPQAATLKIHQPSDLQSETGHSFEVKRPENHVGATPLAKALFQLENKRHA